MIFFKNPKIKPEGLFKVHAQQTTERIKSLEEETVLIDHSRWDEVEFYRP